MRHDLACVQGMNDTVLTLRRVLFVCLMVLQDNKHQSRMVCFVLFFYSVGALWVRAPGHAAGGALYIITHMLGRQIHFVNKGKGQALIRQP